MSFEEFTHTYKEWRAGAGQRFEGFVFLASHVMPVSEVCMVRTLSIATVLRVEQMDLWYDTMMHHYGIDRVEARLREEHHQEFYTPNLNGTTALSEKLPEAFGVAPWAGNALDAGHTRGSVDRLMEFYTPVLAREVFDLQRADFEAFGYPAWDGDPTSFSFLR